MPQFSASQMERIARATKDAEAARQQTAPRQEPNRSAPIHQFVRITSVVQTAGRYPGKWLLYDGATKTYSDGDGDAWVVGANGTALATGVRYLARLTDYQGTPALPVFIVDDVGTAATITVQESDGSPSYGDVSTLQFDVAAGFVVSQPSAGVAKASQTAANETANGYLSFGNQIIGGLKRFNLGVIHLGIAGSAQGAFPLVIVGQAAGEDDATVGTAYIGSEQTSTTFSIMKFYPPGALDDLPDGGVFIDCRESNVVGQPSYGLWDGTTFQVGAWGTLLDGSEVKGGIITTIGTTGQTVTIGTTPVSGGTNGNILQITAGKVGQVATSGSGNVVLATGATLSGPIANYLTTTQTTQPSLANGQIGGPWLKAI